MFSIKGIFANNTIHLQEPLYITNNAKVVVTLTTKPKAKTITEQDLAIASKLLYEMEEKQEFDLTPVEFDSDESDTITKQQDLPLVPSGQQYLPLVPSVDFSSLERGLTNSLNLERQDLEKQDIDPEEAEIDEALIDSNLDSFLDSVDSVNELNDPSLILVRQHNRYNITGTIKIRGREEEYKLQNYSATGLSFLSPTLFAANSEIQATFYEKNGNTKVEFPLRIKHIMRKDDQYLFGCEFTSSVHKNSPLLQAFELLRL